MAATDIVRVHGANQGDVAVGIESSNELVAVKIKVALNGIFTALSQWTDL